ncbi:hypothetical protein LCGC14_1906660, partial [marine sediment metagenome]
PESQVQMVGKRNFNNSEILDGVKDYSISFDGGKSWGQYHRFDPIGSWMAWSADLYTLYHEYYDPDDPTSIESIGAMTQAALAATMRNAMNKTWLKSVNDIVETIGRVSEGSAQTSKLAMQKFSAEQLIKLIPYSSALRSITAETDPVVRDGWKVMDRLQEVNPWMSEGLPATRDYLGRPVNKHNAHWYWINPFATNPESTDPLDQELSDLGYDIARLPKSLNSGQIPLNSLQYSEFKRIIGQGEHMGGGKSLETTLREVVATDFYQRSNDLIRTEIIESYYSGSKEIAAHELKKQFPELREAEKVLQERDAREHLAPRDPFALK